MFARYVPLASENPYPVIVYFVGNFRPHLSHFWAKLANVSFSLSQLLVSHFLFMFLPYQYFK